MRCHRLRCLQCCWESLVCSDSRAEGSDCLSEDLGDLVPRTMTLYLLPLLKEDAMVRGKSSNLSDAVLFAAKYVV